jgi:hypothetical protein
VPDDATVTMPTLLERRYRGWLRLLPVDYRERWAEDMVDTFLATALTGEDADALEIAGYGKPPLAEVASVVGLAVRLRLGTAERAPRPLLWRAAWRRVALLGLLVHAVWAVVSVPGTLWLAGLLPGGPDPDPSGVITPTEQSLMVTLGGVWQTYSSLAGLAWVPAFLLLLHQRRRTAAVLAVVATVPQVWNVVDWVGFLDLEDLSLIVASLVSLVVAVLPVVALVAYVGPVEPVRRRPWLVGAATGTVLLAVVAVLAWQLQPAVLLDPNGLECGALAVGCAFWLRLRRRGDAEPAWTLALAVVAVALLVERVATIAPFWVMNTTPDPLTDGLMHSGAVEAAVVAVTAALFTVAAGRDVRRLPVTVAD